MARNRKKKRADDDDGDDDLPLRRSRVDLDDEDDDGPRPPSKNTAYTGMSLLTAVALVGAAAFFYLDSAHAKAQPLTPPAVNVPALVAAPTAAEAPVK